MENVPISVSQIANQGNNTRHIASFTSVFVWGETSVDLTERIKASIRECGDRGHYLEIVKSLTKHTIIDHMETIMADDTTFDLIISYKKLDIAQFLNVQNNETIFHLKTNTENLSHHVPKNATNLYVDPLGLVIPGGTFQGCYYVKSKLSITN